MDRGAGIRARTRIGLVCTLHPLPDTLCARAQRDSDVEAIAHGNMLRVLIRVWTTEREGVSRTTGSQYIQLPNTLKFEWDPNKNRANAAKHDIDFIEAAAAFTDPNHDIKPSSRSHAVEERHILTGCPDRDRSRVLTIVFTIRNGKIRILSARKASRRERREYRLREALS